MVKTLFQSLLNPPALLFSHLLHLKSESLRTQIRLFRAFILMSCPPLLHSAQYPRCPGGGASRSPADATGQHAAGGGRGWAGERRRVGSCGSRCGRHWRRRRRQLSRTLRLPGQAVADPTNLPHGAGEV